MIVVLVGPSAVGKSTISAALVERGYRQLVSCTTRPPRPGELDGRDYHFQSQVEFDNMLGRDELAEHSWAFGYSYGLPRSEVDGEGPAVAVMDLRGASALKASYPDTVVTFAVVPASWDILETRLQERGGSAEDIAARLATARAEVHAACKACDEEVVNGRIQQAAAEIMAVAVGHGPWITAKV